MGDVEMLLRNFIFQVEGNDDIAYLIKALLSFRKYSTFEIYIIFIYLQAEADLEIT